MVGKYLLIILMSDDTILINTIDFFTIFLFEVEINYG